jgi:hypothetical protein
MRIAGVPEWIQKEYLTNTNCEIYHYTIMLSQLVSVIQITAYASDYRNVYRNNQLRKTDFNQKIADFLLKICHL